MKRLILILCLIAGPVFAVQPDEVLDDPLLELRAREISKNLRCLVCRNESIDESNADIARDLRLLVRARLMAGDSDGEVIDYIVNGVPGEFTGYGEYVLLRPLGGGINLVLWAAGPAMFLIALGIGGGYLRNRAKAGAKPIEALSTDEQKRLDEILKD